jgi:hypothetical protein
MKYFSKNWDEGKIMPSSSRFPEIYRFNQAQLTASCSLLAKAMRMA